MSAAFVNTRSCQLYRLLEMGAISHAQYIVYMRQLNNENCVDVHADSAPSTSSANNVNMEISSSVAIPSGFGSLTHPTGTIQREPSSGHRTRDVPAPTNTVPAPANTASSDVTSFQTIDVNGHHVCQYIGEICRYLLNHPKVPEETQHSVRLMFGNGLRPHIWKEFQERFKIKSIVEMYGATEGNANIVNAFGKVGAVGFVSKIFSRKNSMFLIKVDPETHEQLRDKNGFCIRCKPGEPGELVGKVGNNPLNSFDGYVDAVDTKKKLIRNCFQKGDVAFLSGDILVMDEDGYLYFVDRIGDTFRWKGENISTGEVENIVGKVLNHITCIVYGVEIPGIEGRAGMVAIQIEGQDINLEKFYKSISGKLPTYSVPLFVRICNKIEATGTHKLKKVTFQKQGCNPGEISDSLYILDSKKGTYVSLTKDIYSDVINGRWKL